jgi:hypothetical protein
VAITFRSQRVQVLFNKHRIKCHLYLLLGIDSALDSDSGDGRSSRSNSLSVIPESHHGPAPTPGKGSSNSGSDSDSRTEATPARSNNDGEYSMGSPANGAESEQGQEHVYVTSG